MGAALLPSTRSCRWPARSSRRRVRSRRWIGLAPTAVLVVALLPACRARREAVVIGIQSEPMGGAIASLHVVIRVDGVLSSDETLAASPRAPLAFPAPWEARLVAPDEREHRVEVEVSAFDAAHVQILRRLGATRFAAGREMLLRLRLEPRCIVYPSAPRAPGSPPGPLNGPTCAAPETCIRGSCVSAEVPAGKLERYVPSWASLAPDECLPDDGGTPSIQVGTGRLAYAPLEPGETLAAEPGPQGGHHLWIAVRARNFHQAGTTITISAVAPGSGVAIPPSTFQFPLDAEEGGYCQVYGMRYQLDNGGIDYTQFLGKPLDVTVISSDRRGARASSTVHIRVAEQLAPAPP